LVLTGKIVKDIRRNSIW